jgi:hypothetical protein
MHSSRLSLLVLVLGSEKVEKIQKMDQVLKKNSETGKHGSLSERMCAD